MSKRSTPTRVEALSQKTLPHGYQTQRYNELVRKGLTAMAQEYWETWARAPRTPEEVEAGRQGGEADREARLWNAQAQARAIVEGIEERRRKVERVKGKGRQLED